MRAAGLDRAEAVQAYRAIAAYARGFALAEIAGFTLESAEPEGEPAAGAGQVYADDFPMISELSAALAEPDREATFAFGLDASLDGILRRPERGRRRAAKPRTTQSPMGDEYSPRVFARRTER